MVNRHKVNTVAQPNQLTWRTLLAKEKNKPYFSQLMRVLQQQRAQGKVIYPPQKDIFNALKLTPFIDTKVVIIGQDPYHGAGQAHGLAFSVPPGIKTPPSLQNIFKELQADLKLSLPNHGCLNSWASQGVLLLNTVLTVEAGLPQSHAKIGWQQFTDTVICSLNQHPQPIVFLLWGAYAQSKMELINQSRHTILATTHPSPLSAHRGFSGCRHFSKANKLLCLAGREQINWV